MPCYYLLRIEFTNIVMRGELLCTIYICGAIFIGLGLFTAICPKKATKKEDSENEEAVKKVRRNGFIEIACGIKFILLDYYFQLNNR